MDSQNPYWTEEEMRAMQAHVGRKDLYMMRYIPSGRVAEICDAGTYEVLDIVKGVDKTSAEYQVVTMLLKLGLRSHGQDHTIPVKLVECENTVLIFMPSVFPFTAINWRTLDQNALYDIISQMIEGVRFMHEHHIAHVDICHDNMVYSLTERSWGEFQIRVSRLYFIDFGSARYIPPGSSPIVDDFHIRGSQYRPPGDTDPDVVPERVDVFAHDIYSLGHAFELMFERALKRGFILLPSVENFISTLTAINPNDRPDIHRAHSLWTEVRGSMT